MPSRKRNEQGAASRRPQAGGGAARLRVTLTRSLIGLKPAHVRTLQALGLRRIRATVEHADTPAIRGMLARVPYAIRVEAVRMEEERKA
ncbi:MAG: 50S ribosomal protein L30 [Candidatus Rokubacteria bacterium]|nr:50S ribosomal protein L30 [Candidatus Rokubacteria bacterium]